MYDKIQRLKAKQKQYFCQKNRRASRMGSTKVNAAERLDTVLVTSAWCLRRPDWRKYTTRVKEIEWLLVGARALYR